MSHPLTVLVLTPSVGGHYYGEVIAGINREVAMAGGHIVLVQTLDGGVRNDEESEVSSFATAVAWSHVDGVVAITTAVHSSYLQRLRDAGKPVVLASTRMPDFAAPLAVPDNFGGTFAAVEHLISHGRTRIGFLGNLAQPDVCDRYAAYQQALEAHDLPHDACLVFDAPNNDFPGGAHAAQHLLALQHRPDAVMVATDRNAIGLLRTLNDAGVAVPDDIAVVGNDNMEEAAFSSPPLTSINQRFDDVGALAGRLVLAQIRGEAVTFGPHVLPTAPLALRASCGCTTDAFGIGIAGYDPSHTDPPAQLRADLQATLCHALLTGHSARDQPLLEAIVETVGEVENIVRGRAGTTAVTVSDIRSLLASLRRLAIRPEMLRRISGAVMTYVERSLSTASVQRAPGVETAHGAADADGAGSADGAVRADDAARADGAVRADGAARADLSQLTTALWKLQAGAFLQQAETTEAALQEQYVVDAGMLDAARSDPQNLRWLDATHVQAGVLALWRGSASGRLRITGSYDPQGLLPDLVGAVTTPRNFPPARFIEAAGTSAGGVCIVVPVRTRDRDWGLLAVLGEINSSSALETYRHWAAQLCAAFEAQELQQAVSTSEERYALAARASNDGLWEWDPRARNIYLSERCLALLGLKPASKTALLVAWVDQIHPDDVTQARQQMQRVADGDEETISTEYRIRVADGSYRWVVSRALGVRCADGSVERVVGSLSDIHERRCLEDKLRENALYDALTGLPNRRLFLSRLEHAVALWQRAQTPFAVIFLDLDGFKAINDSLGHQMGDRVLHAVGARIEHELRGVDTGARFGGDEFAILLDDTDEDGVLQVARRVQSALAQVIDLDGNEFNIGASLGVATSAIGYTTAEDVLRDADTAMYRAKETQRGAVSFFDADMHVHAMQELRLNADIRHALEQQQFEMRYQPIVNLVTGRTDRFEALVRWHHPDRGLIMPDEFLPAMAETGAIIALGHWIIDEVCRQLAAWGPGVVNVALNVSDREFWHGDVLAHVLDSLERHSLTPDRLTLEITEGVIMRRPDAALSILRDLHEAGLQLHIDDFGTGYSSLETLHRYPVDAFKIDRSFIAGLTTSDRTEELVRAIIAMGKALGLDVVAEGVETGDQLRFLQQIGCATAQGFLFMPAVSGEHAPKLLGRVLGPELLGPEPLGPQLLTAAPELFSVPPAASEVAG